jgi:hypothetical protein
VRVSLYLRQIIAVELPAANLSAATLLSELSASGAFRLSWM